MIDHSFATVLIQPNKKGIVNKQLYKVQRSIGIFWVIGLFVLCIFAALYASSGSEVKTLALDDEEVVVGDLALPPHLEPGLLV